MMFVLLSFADKYFMKFVILCIIDTTIGLILLKYNDFYFIKYLV